MWRLCAGKGCDEGCDGGPSADQQWEDSAELGSSEHATLSSGQFLRHTHRLSRNENKLSAAFTLFSENNLGRECFLLAEESSFHNVFWYTLALGMKWQDSVKICEFIKKKTNHCGKRSVLTVSRAVLCKNVGENNRYVCRDEETNGVFQMTYFCTKPLLWVHTLRHCTARL